LIITILIIYRLIYSYFYSKSIPIAWLKLSIRYSVGDKISTFFNFKSVCLVGISFLLVFYLNRFNIVSMLFRGGDLKETISISSHLSLVISKFFQPMPVFIFILYFWKSNRRLPYVILYLLFMLVVCSPIGMPRFAAASLYIAVLMATLPLFRLPY